MINVPVEQLVTPEQINLKSFERKSRLNPKFWPNGKLNPKVRKRLLEISAKFYESLDIDWVLPSDVVLVGSMASYNWSKYSDVDLHVMMSYSMVDKRREFAANYLAAKKNEWNDSHENLTIFGYPVELYVQDPSDPDTPSGMYSVKYDRWIKFPEGGTMEMNRELIKRQAATAINTIEYYEKKFEDVETPELMDILRGKVDLLYRNIVDGRRAGVASKGESAPENITFKVLRRSGHLGRLHDLKDKIYDKMNSIS